MLVNNQVFELKYQKVEWVEVIMGVVDTPLFPPILLCNIACQSLVQMLQNAPCKQLAQFLRWNDGIDIQ